jgi:hypothetical protein
VVRASNGRSAPSPATIVAGLALLLLGAGVATAAPAGAIEDPARPDARVTHGPSCEPGGVVVQVTAGTAPYAVRLATTRAPGGEDSAELVPGETVVLRTGGVEWGETIDSRLEYTALDGSGVSYVDELAVYTFTRPTEADCAAIRGTAAPDAPGAEPDAVPAADLPEDVADTAPTIPQLQVAASTRPAGAATDWPLAAAALALLSTGGAVGFVAARRRQSPAAGPTTGSA